MPSFHALAFDMQVLADKYPYGAPKNVGGVLAKPGNRLARYHLHGPPAP
jgi:hypothetical protein